MLWRESWCEKWRRFRERTGDKGSNERGQRQTEVYRCSVSHRLLLST
jgi:hypothetical protein